MSLSREQSELRSTRVGASEVAALLGESAYHGPWDVYDRIVLQQQREANEAMRLGSLIEDANVFVPALKWRGMVARRCHRAYAHPTLPLSASPDLFVNQWAGNPRGLGETKVSNARIVEGHVPPWWEAQVQTQLGLAKREVGYLIVLNGSKLTITEVPRDREYFDRIEQAVAAFQRDHLGPRVRPVEPPFVITKPEEKKAK